MHRGRSLLAALLTAALASACTPDAAPTQSPTPVPSPTFSCSTSTVNDPCTEEKAQKEKETAAAVAQATSAYDAFLAEYIRVTRAGGSAKATTAMSEYAAGPYLALYTQYVQRVRTRGWTYSGQIVSKVFKYSAGEARADSPATELTFDYCQDGRQNRITKDGKLLGKGILVAGKIYVRPVDGKMRLWDSAEQEVSSCAEGI